MKASKKEPENKEDEMEVRPDGFFIGGRKVADWIKTFRWEVQTEQKQRPHKPLTARSQVK